MLGSTWGRLGTVVNEIEASGRLGTWKRLFGEGFKELHNKCAKRPLSGHYWPIIGALFTGAKNGSFSLPGF